MNHVRLLSTMVAFAFAAGCVQDAQSSSQPELDLDGDLGAVLGLVVSEELFPVPGATVAVDGGPSTVTDEGGRFELVEVAPGTRTLNVTAEGYEATTLEAEVPEGASIEVKVALKGLPGETPYVTTIPYEGYVVCAFSAVYTAGWPGLAATGPVPCPLGTRNAVMKVEVGPDWRAGIYEMAWKTSEEMIFATHVRTPERPDNSIGCQTSGSTHDWCPSMVWGRSPLKIIARPEDPDYAKKYAIDGKEMWPHGNFTSHIFTSYSGYFRGEINQTFYNQCVLINRQFNVPEHWGCPFGVGFALGTRFQFYHTTFYLAAPLELEAFSALPDA